MANGLPRSNPLTGLDDLQARVDRMFNSFLGDREHMWVPTIDLIRAAGSLKLRADIPGVRAEDVKIEIRNDVLTISGEHEEKTEEKGEHFLRRERRYGSFARSVVVPPGIDPEKIDATVDDGVLELKLPLPAESATKPVQIAAVEA